MDPTAERMPIACVHCAKAKAKCDKKVPCTRCVGKQITCQSRATRRSSQNPSRRNNTARTISERNIQASAIFHVAKPSRPRSQHRFDQTLKSTNTADSGAQYSPSDASGSGHPSQSLQIVPVGHCSEGELQMLRTSVGNTPPEFGLPITPMMQDIPQIDAFLNLDTMNYESEADLQFYNANGLQPAGTFENHDQNVFGDLFSSSIPFRGPADFYIDDGKGPLTLSSDQIPMPASMSSYCPMTTEFGYGCLPQSATFAHEMTPRQAGFTFPAQALQESDAVTMSQMFLPFFQCNPVDSYAMAPPKTAGIYLEGLAQTLRDQATWQSWSAVHLDACIGLPKQEHISVELIVDWPREKLLAITQGFLHKALDIHRTDQTIKDDALPSPSSGHEAFLMLPPPQVMNHFLQNYVTRYEPYYPSVAGSRLDPNALLHGQNSKAAALLTLLMAASGASATPALETRFFASGLTEACRISLFDVIEKDVLQAREPLILRSAFLFTCLAAWSGDKWHMDMAMGQRGMYLAMLSHSGILNPSGSYLEIGNCKANPERAWEDWKEHEGQHRLAHAWIVLDQEMSLFSDAAPLLSIVDFHCPMADADVLWHAESAVEWLDFFEQVHSSAYKSSPSVRDLFSKFVDRDLDGKSLSPTNLRLLLHPIQAQICQLRQFMTCLPHKSGQQANQIPSRSGTKSRLEELIVLLKRWYALSKHGVSGCKGPCWTTYANLIMYHLISLNTMTSFKCIEQFARKEITVAPAKYVSWLQTRCVDQTEEIYFHCGQVLRLLQALPSAVRPPWWAGAIYRVALTAWATSFAANGIHSNTAEATMVSGPQFAIDGLMPEHETVSRYVKYQEGTPVFTGCDGMPVLLSNPDAILTHCANFLAEDTSMRLTDTIKRKLYLLADCWNSTV